MTRIIAGAELEGSEPLSGSSVEIGHRDLLRFLACGSVDDGKSTLIGRLLYDSHAVHDDQIEALADDSRRFGTQGGELDLTLLVDGLSAEREQGITIDVAYRYFSTPRRSFIVADTPGHEQYTRNMATGASTADAAVILIDARKGILPQTRRHSFIASMLGVRHIAVAVNKMDLVAYDRAHFEQIAKAYRNLAAELEFATVVFFPISALRGDNVVRRSPTIGWWEGSSLLEFLETLDLDARTRTSGGLLPVQWVNRPDAQFRGYSGSVASGRICRGDDVVALPRGLASRVERIVAYDGDLAQADSGQSVTLVLADALDVSRGDWLAVKGTQVVSTRSLRAKLLWTGESPLDPSASYLLKIGTRRAIARLSLDHAIDIHSYASTAASRLEMNDIGAATIALDREVIATDYAVSRDCGGFILIDRMTNDTVAFGMVACDGKSIARPSE